MEFSHDMLIQIGLDMAGYMIIGILLYVLLSRRFSGRSRPEGGEKPVEHTVEKPHSEVKLPRRIDPTEFIDLPESREESQLKIIENHKPLRVAVLQDPVPTSRRENRRAIYQEARKLLAQGHSRGDLMSRLPLTEIELEMLSAAGQA